jgi:hypothetical protein
MGILCGVNLSKKKNNLKYKIVRKINNKLRNQIQKYKISFNHNATQKSYQTTQSISKISK